MTYQLQSALYENISSLKKFQQLGSKELHVSTDELHQIIADVEKAEKSKKRFTKDVFLLKKKGEICSFMVCKYEPGFSTSVRNNTKVKRIDIEQLGLTGDDKKDQKHFKEFISFLNDIHPHAEIHIAIPYSKRSLLENARDIHPMITSRIKEDAFAIVDANDSSAYPFEDGIEVSIVPKVLKAEYLHNLVKKAMSERAFLGQRKLTEITGVQWNILAMDRNADMQPILKAEDFSKYIKAGDTLYLQTASPLAKANDTAATALKRIFGEKFLTSIKKNEKYSTVTITINADNINRILNSSAVVGQARKSFVPCPDENVTISKIESPDMDAEQLAAYDAKAKERLLKWQERLRDNDGQSEMQR